VVCKQRWRRRSHLQAIRNRGWSYRNGIVMIEIRNKKRSPVQVLVRSKTAPRQFTTLIIPGIGKGQNIRYITDEAETDVIKRVEQLGLITTRYIPNRVEKDIQTSKGVKIRERPEIDITENRLSFE
jgi:hypothetical protein